jgi:hypothetical protein
MSRPTTNPDQSDMSDQPEEVIVCPKSPIAAAGEPIPPRNAPPEPTGPEPTLDDGAKMWHYLMHLVMDMMVVAKLQSIKAEAVPGRSSYLFEIEVEAGEDPYRVELQPEEEA